ncbi:MAG TPA: glycoside hydrolase family 15 protein [Pyrinomonadaceae bacterium]|nr:glycoside hydrolase family 15 protein [Pyrinomonadaceae bacterium]
MRRICLLILLGSRVVMAQGGDAHWPTAAKNGFGTSNTLASKVWFTLADGVMTEVFYPTLDMPSVKTLQFRVVMGTKIENEVDDTLHRLDLPNPSSLMFRQVNRAKTGAYTISKTYVTDPRRSSVLIRVDFDTATNAQLYVNYDPLPNDKSALISTCGFPKLEQRHCTLALGFGQTRAKSAAIARASLVRGFGAVKREYESGWQKYVATLPVIPKHQRHFNMAAMVLKGLEDKTYRGAVIASPSTPWGGGGPNATGYHAVWSRDLYHVATALDAMGDRAGANRLLDYLFNVQQKPDGSFPQNSWVDGRPIGNGVQMDQVAWPLVLAYQLKRQDRNSWLKHIRPAADFILARGPRTDQDRWEEEPGYSPATIAAQIAGLVCAAEIAKLNGDNTTAAKYLETADNWARNVEKWTVLKSNEFGYYMRITNDNRKIEINSSRLVVDEWQLLDPSFLELVRLGIKSPRDPRIVDSLELIDQLIKVKTPAGDAWYRYNLDAYGETREGGNYDARNGIGRLWTLLTGERGEYEVANGDIASARTRLDTLALFANDGLMIPEQVWDRQESPTASLRFGVGTGSATPLAWSMAQFIRLAISIERGRNVETPRVVWERYGSRG